LGGIIPVLNTCDSFALGQSLPKIAPFFDPALIPA
jgi:hypothetical protein